MSIPLSYRAELANQVLAALRLLPEAAWDEACRRRLERRHLHELVSTLAEHGVELLGEEFGAECLAIARAHLADVELVAPAAMGERYHVARGAVLAAFLRDSAGFNSAAFHELIHPVATLVDFAAVEKTARDAVLGALPPMTTPVASPAPILRRA